MQVRSPWHRFIESRSRAAMRHTNHLFVFLAIAIFSTSLSRKCTPPIDPLHRPIPVRVAIFFTVPRLVARESSRLLSAAFLLVPRAFLQQPLALPVLTETFQYLLRDARRVSSFLLPAVCFCQSRRLGSFYAGTMSASSCLPRDRFSRLHADRWSIVSL